MEERNLPSSDDSDEDFIPKEEENSGSGSEVSDYETSDGETQGNKSNKRKRRSKKSVKRIKANDEKIEEEDVVEEKQNIDVDALWADFKKDVSKVETKKPSESSDSVPETKLEVVNKETTETKSANSKPKTGFSLPARSKGGGLSSVLSKIGKKDKMSTLQKSQLDWNNFKKSEGIEEEIKTYNKGKDGYLERQDFLQRTDLRQFEIEKDLRSARRKF